MEECVSNFQGGEGDRVGRGSVGDLDGSGDRSDYGEVKKSGWVLIYIEY